MSTSTDFVHCMLIPLQQHYLLLPNSTIAEVIPKKALQSATLPPYWKGYLQWRDQSLPVVDLEGLIEQRQFDDDSITKYCILNGINAEAKISFYALPCCGSPQLITLNESALQQTHDSNSSDYLCCQIKIGNKVAYIPNLDQLENTIRNHSS